MVLEQLITGEKNNQKSYVNREGSITSCGSSVLISNTNLFTVFTKRRKSRN